MICKELDARSAADRPSLSDKISYIKKFYIPPGMATGMKNRNRLIQSQIREKQVYGI